MEHIRIHRVQRGTAVRAQGVLPLCWRHRSLCRELLHSIASSSPESEKSSIKVQQIPDKRNDREPVLFTDGTDPVLESFPVQGNDLEYQYNALRIKAVVRVRGNSEGMREPGTTYAAGQRNGKDEPVRTPDNNCGPHPPLLMSFCIGEIHEPDSTVLHRSVLQCF